MELAAVAAFVAAGLSLVNVVITARLASQGRREQWRRDEERPIVARCLTLSEDALTEWGAVSRAKQRADVDADVARTWEDPQFDKGRGLLHDLRYEAAQLDLLASSTVRRVASALVMAHQEEIARVLLDVEPGQDDREGRAAAQVRFRELHSALVETTRTDLGLGLRVPPRSLLGKLLAGRSGQ